MRPLRRTPAPHSMGINAGRRHPAAGGPDIDDAERDLSVRLDSGAEPYPYGEVPRGSLRGRPRGAVLTD